MPTHSASRSGPSESPVDSPDLVSDAIGEVRQLLDRALREVSDRSRSDVVAVESTDSPDTARQTLVDALSRARHLVCIVMPDDTRGAQAVHAALLQVLNNWPATVHANLLCTSSALTRFGLGELSRASPALRVRVAPGPIPALAIVDLKYALVRGVLPHPAYRASMVHDGAAVETLHAMFLHQWQGGIAADAYGALTQLLRRRGGALALRYLNSGHTDEAAAAELGVSVRTYRRYVAEVMAALGVKSRFQVGVMANRLGLLTLLPPVYPDPPDASTRG